MIVKTTFCLLAFAVILCVAIDDNTINDQEHEHADDVVTVFTVASSPTEGFQRYNRSAAFYNIRVETLGMGAGWQGGDMNHAGGGYKINLLKKAIKPLVTDKEAIVLFTDGYDVVFTESLDAILEKFQRTDARVLFGAEHVIWPDETLEHLYPASEGARFLNSGMFMGYATDVYEILKSPIKNTDDDQLFFTHAYLDQNVREKLKIQLDHKSRIFQNLYGAMGEVQLKYNDYGEALLFNNAHHTRPSIVHGNGLAKVHINDFGNYLAGAFSNERCMVCDDNNIVLNDDELPAITLAIFVEKPTPFLAEFFDSILAIDYPKKSINVFLHNAIEFHADVVNKFVDHFGPDYAGVKTILPADNVEEKNARNLAVVHTQNRKSDYMFVVDSEARLNNPKTLRELLRHNRTVISPKMTRPGEVWSNFWGALNKDEYYARSHDYMDIANDNIRGIWNVPYIASCYLVKKSVLHLIDYADETIDPEMKFARQLRRNGIFMFTMNLNDYGHLVNSDSYSPLLARPDFYQMLANRADWETRYIHPEYAALLQPNVTYKQPCTDVYWFPIVTEQFCEDLIAIMENFGKWSDGTNTDERIGGGYEAVPTRDIHMSQVGLEQMWLKFLQIYVRPLQEAVFTGYFHNPPKAIMNFVVRYRPTEQPYLKPHHDSSTYTINIALNRAGIDYSGGGCRFLRYNCAVRDTKMGHMLMHPGRLTHFHEGMHTTNGTRYIMISFVDP